MGESEEMLKYGLMISMLVMGAGNTLLFKYQNIQFELGQDFSHPYMQTLTMFMGEFACIFLYLLQKKYQAPLLEKNLLEAEKKNLITKYTPLWFLVPTGCDFVTSTLQFFGLTMLNPSIYQMLRGGVIVVTALASYFFLGRKYYRHHLLGIFFVVLGVSLVGVSAFSSSKNTSQENSNQTLGVTLILISLITNGALFVSEEKIFQHYHIEPLLVTATEGFWGICMCLFFIPIFNFIKLPQDLSAGICAPTSCQTGGTRYMERTDIYFQQMGQNAGLVLAIIGAMFTIAIFNVSGVGVTKYMSSLIRSILDVTRTILVWGVSLFLKKANGEAWETFHLLELLGFLILVLGNFIFNEIIIIKLCGMDKYIKENLQNQDHDSQVSSLKNKLVNHNDESYTNDKLNN